MNSTRKCDNPEVEHPGFPCNHAEPADDTRTEVIVHRATKRSAEAYIARLADCLGDTTYWNGSRHVPVHIEWTVVPAEQGGFDVVSTVTPR